MNICEQQFGYMQTKRTTDACFEDVLLEKNRDDQKELWFG